MQQVSALSRGPPRAREGRAREGRELTMFHCDQRRGRGSVQTSRKRGRAGRTFRASVRSCTARTTGRVSCLSAVGVDAQTYLAGDRYRRHIRPGSSECCTAVVACYRVPVIRRSSLRCSLALRPRDADECESTGTRMRGVKGTRRGRASTSGPWRYGDGREGGEGLARDAAEDGRQGGCAVCPMCPKQAQLRALKPHLIREG